MLSVVLQYDPVIPLLGINPKDESIYPHVNI